MFLFLSVLAVCGTFVWTVRYLVEKGVRLPSPRLEVAISAAPTVAPQPSDEPRQPTLPSVPREILDFCAQESEPFMREALLEQAFAECRRAGGEWEGVLETLKRSVGEATVATDNENDNE